MIIRYNYINGDRQEIEVDDALGALLLDLDRAEYNNNHKETRRHASLDGMDYEGGIFTAADDPVAEAELRADIAALADAMEVLTSDQRALLRRFYFEGQRIVDIARADGVSHAAILDRLNRIYKRIKKYL